MALPLQAAILLDHANPAVAEAYCLARLGPDRSLEHGALPDGVDVALLVEQA